MGEEGGVVMEGRDIGTVVFPNAEVKVFLTAYAGERARRRAAQLKDKGHKRRSRSDSRRNPRAGPARQFPGSRPLKQAPDAVLLETDGMTVEQVVDAVLAIHNERVSQ